MTPHAGSYPPFSWSWTRADTLARCPRRYYFRCYAAPRGRRVGADPLDRTAYRLRQLRSLPMVLGVALHDRAREVASAIRSAQALPSTALLEGRTRAQLNAAYRGGKDRRAYEADPWRSPMLQELYYRGPLTREYIDWIDDRLTASVANLREAPVWEELRSVPRSATWVVDSLAHFVLDGVTVWAAPDLVYSMPGGGTTIIDWKSGRVDQVEGQLAVYSLLVERSRRSRTPEEEHRGVAVGLAEGQMHTATLTVADRAAAESGIRESMATMRSLLRDPLANEPLGVAAFPRTRRWAECQHCPFLELCTPEIERDARALVCDAGRVVDAGSSLGGRSTAMQAEALPTPPTGPPESVP